MGSAPGVMSMLTLPQKHVAAEGGAAEDILAQPLRSSLPAPVERAWLRTRELAGRPACAGAAEFSSADETESESSICAHDKGGIGPTRLTVQKTPG